MTKKQRSIYEQYLRSNYHSLYECYKRPSDAKLSIEFDIKYYMRKNGGYDFKILSFNTFMFTCAYLIDIDGKTHIKYDSPANSYLFPIE